MLLNGKNSFLTQKFEFSHPLLLKKVFQEHVHENKDFHLTVYFKHKKKIDWNFHYMHETVPPSATHREWQHREWRSASPTRLEKRIPMICHRSRNFFVRGGNWKFWTLITCRGPFCGRLHRVGDGLDGKTMKNTFLLAKKSISIHREQSSIC